MDQELKTGAIFNFEAKVNMEVDANSKASAITGPRAVTTKTWVAALNYISPFLEPVTPDLMLYVSDMCTLSSLLTCIPYAAALLLYRLRCVPLLTGWMSNQAYLVTVVNGKNTQGGIFYRRLLCLVGGSEQRERPGLKATSSLASTGAIGL